MRVPRAAIVLLVLLDAAGARAQPPPIADGGFVRAEGTRFVVEDRAFSVVGANAAVMHGRAQRATMRETLSAAAADGLSVVRVWALGEYPSDAPAWAREYAFRVGADGWVEESFEHLDRVLAEARRLGLRVVVVLANRWGDYGGVPAYLRWAGVEPPERHVPPLGLTAFWDHAECEARYREHARRVVLRVNGVTGVAYRDDPTIFAWELINEAEGAGAAGEEAMLRWMDRQARFLRELDPRHMISAGHIGYSRRRDRALWARACALEAVSYCDSHAYPLRSGRVRTAALLSRWIDDRVQLAHHGVGKPLLFGEIGVPADRRVVHGRPRARWLSLFLERVLADGAAGAMAWTYLPSEARQRTYAIYAHGESAASTMDLRRALARAASRARRRPPRVESRAVRADRGDALLFDPTVRARGPGDLHAEWTDEGEASVLYVDPLAFDAARFEGTGTFDGASGIAHFYGAGAGSVSYRLRLPRDLETLTVRLRVSSELPGAGGGASEADTSTLTIAIDGVDLGTVVAPPDDGVGAWIELEVSAETLRSLPRGGARRLEIRASEAGAGGVCIYARTERGEPAGIQLHARRAGGTNGWR